MKTKYLFTILILFLLSSCDDFLKEEPFSFLTQDNFPGKVEDADIALNGAYYPLTQNFIRGYQNLLGTCAGTDLTTYGGSKTNAYAMRAFYVWSPADRWPVRRWDHLYQGINACNFIIESVNEKGYEGADKAVAEALALRAFYYLELTITYGDVPLKLDQSKGIDGLDLPRESVDVIRTAMLEDLTSAENIMEEYPEIYKKVYTRQGKLTLGAVKMIKAHYYMYMAGWRRSWDGQMIEGDKSYWTNVRDLCQEIIAMGVYELDPDFTNVFKDLYRDIYNKELIWEIDHSMPDNGSTFPNALTAGKYGAGKGGGFASLRSNLDFWDLYDPLDVRRDWTLGHGSFKTGYDFVPSNNQRGKRPKINKFRKVPGNGDHAWRTPYNIPVYRFSAVYLMLAEALNEINDGPSPEAYAAINTVRERARPAEHKTDGTVLPDLSGLNYESFKLAIIDERAFELAMEGFRRYDIIRWNIFLERVKMVSDDYYGGFQEANVRDFHMLEPIPLQEMDLNPEWRQNDGY